MSELAAAAADALDVRHMAIGRVLPGDSPVVSMDFHEGGELLVISTADRSIILVNAVEGRVRKTVHSQTHGPAIVRFTHHEQVCAIWSELPLCSSSRMADSRIHTLHSCQTEHPNQQRWP